jgi:transcriptional regulator with XRE-family HTH domain
MIAESGVSPSTYRSYEEDARSPSINAVGPLAGFLCLGVEELLFLYASAPNYVPPLASGCELAPRNTSSGADWTTHVLHEAPRDSNWNGDDDCEDPATGLDVEKDENSARVRGTKMPGHPSGGIAKSDEDALFRYDVLEGMGDHDEEERSAYSVGDFVAQPRSLDSSLRLNTRQGARN